MEKKYVKAQDKFYHENHFICVVCSKDLTDVPVYTKDDNLYCEQHFKSLFLPVCCSCDDYIESVSNKEARQKLNLCDNIKQT